MRDLTIISSNGDNGFSKYSLYTQQSAIKNRVFISVDNTGVMASVHVTQEDAETLALAILAELRDQGYGDYGNL